MMIYLNNETQANTCHLVDKSVVEQQGSLVADSGTNSYTLLPLRFFVRIVVIED